MEEAKTPRNQTGRCFSGGRSTVPHVRPLPLAGSENMPVPEGWGEREHATVQEVLSPHALISVSAVL